MKKKIGLFLITAMVLNSVSLSAFAWKNPLKEYNLYEDTHPKSINVDNSDREQVMSDYYQNSLAGKNSSQYNVPDLPPSNLTEETSAEGSVKKPLSRNEALRESSRNVYTPQDAIPGWLIGPVYYPEPTLDSIIEKYHRSDFAGCLQECMSYVRQNPNSTLGYYYLAMCYTKVSDSKNAIMAYEKVIELNDNPMIVKYATNGRNCVMGETDQPCYQNVNVPELVYPYKDIVAKVDLTPVDPDELVNENLKVLREILAVDKSGASSEKDKNSKNSKVKNTLLLPFGKQDEDLDKFINAPYGDGLSPQLNREYKQIQLRKIQNAVNLTEEAKGEKADKQKVKNLKEIKKFDKKHSDAGLAKLAMADMSSEYEKLSKDPEFIRQRQEYEEIQMLLGNEKNNDNKNDMMDLMPYMSEQNGKNLSPEVMQSLMMQSMMGNITL